MEGDSIETSLREFFAAHSAEDIAAAYLFGSMARGTARQGSDVNVGVLYAGDPPVGLVSFCLEGELERYLCRAVRVVILNRAPVDLVHRVLRDGKLAFERDRSRRIAFEVRSRNEFFDLQPVLRRYRRIEGRCR